MKSRGFLQALFHRVPQCRSCHGEGKNVLNFHTHMHWHSCLFGDWILTFNPQNTADISPLILTLSTDAERTHSCSCSLFVHTHTRSLSVHLIFSHTQTQSLTVCVSPCPASCTQLATESFHQSRAICSDSIGTFSEKQTDREGERLILELSMPSRNLKDIMDLYRE